MAGDPIRHVIVLVLENRSFDHMLGGLQGKIEGLDGVPPEGPPRENRDHEGNIYRQLPGAALALDYDPKHELNNVLMQIGPSGGPANTGFVEDFSRAYPLSAVSDRAEVMKFHGAGTLPALHTLAQNFTVCDRWFSAVPGPTWPNRFFIHSGTSIGRVSMPNGIMDANLHWYDQTTLYDRLDEVGKRWRIYYGDVPQSIMLVHQMEPANARNYYPLRSFFIDAAGKEEAFPDYAFIEPPYYDPGASDDHPPHDVREAERLIADIYNALRRNEPLWQTTLLVLLYDEHGGFYDHVQPGATVPPDHYLMEYSFDRLGVRVPALLVSPFAPRTVVHTPFDHTSLLRYLIDKWRLGPLGERAGRANSFADALLASPRPAEELPPSVPLLSAAGLGSDRYGQIRVRAQPRMSENQSALFGISQLLESFTDVAGHELMGRTKRLLTGFDGAVDVAIERVEQFLGRHRQNDRTGGAA